MPGFVHEPQECSNNLRARNYRVGGGMIVVSSRVIDQAMNVLLIDVLLHYVRTPHCQLVAHSSFMCNDLQDVALQAFS